MSEGDLSSKETNAADGDDSGDDEGHTPRLGERFRAPTSGGVGISDSDSGDEAVDQVAKRFRGGPRLGEPVDDAKSLDQQDEDVDSADEGSVLDALDGVGEETEVEESDGVQPDTEASVQPPRGGEEEDSGDLPVVDVEPIDGEDDDSGEDAESDGAVCPSCHAENPSGMRFCVECGGSLEGPEQDKGESRLKGKAEDQAVKSLGADREPPPATDAAEEENPWDIDMVCINEDGSDGKAISLDFLETTIGREADDRFPTDSFLSPKHARFHVEDGQLFIEDLYSLNGTFIKLRDETRLTPGDTILMGRQVLRFERFDQSITAKTKNSDGTRYMGSPAPGGNFKILQVGIGGVVQNVYCLPEDGAVLGREKGDIVFPHDKFMSGRHAQIYSDDDDHCYLVDLESSNGTWIKIWEKTALDDDDYVFMGQQLFRVDYGD